MFRKHNKFFVMIGTLTAVIVQLIILIDCITLIPVIGVRAILLGLLNPVGLGLITWSTIRLRRSRSRQTSQSAGERYYSSQFANTFLFEYRFRARTLTFSGNVPMEMGISIHRIRSLAQFRELIHPHDLGKLDRALEAPPAPREEVVREIRLRHSGSAYVWYECRMVATFDGLGQPLVLLGRFENIDARKCHEANLVARSTRDDLTGLLNRSAVILRIEEWLQSPRSKEGCALFMVDLDDFKSINDALGHAAGDRALLLCARVLRESFRITDVLSRVGGDEFLVFMTGVSTPELASKRAEELCHIMAERSIEVFGKDAFTCSVGVALYPQHGRDYTQLFEAADAAMYQAKRNGKNFYSLFSKSSQFFVKT